MAAKTKLGDVYVMQAGDKRKKYLQYVANDSSQLGSHVIRAFSKFYDLDESPSIEEVLQGEVHFYAHCFVNFGLKLGFWEKIGNSPEVGIVPVLFRTNDDKGNIGPSKEWWVWKINEPPDFVGRLRGHNSEAEIGSVMSPVNITYRMVHDKYDFDYAT